MTAEGGLTRGVCVERGGSTVTGVTSRDPVWKQHGNSNQHQHYDVPHILVGGRNLGLQGNRHLAYARKTTTTGNLLLSVMDLYDITRDGPGDSTGRLAHRL